MIPAGLRERLDAQKSHPHTVLSIEEFFHGNEDEGSIGCNLSDRPTHAEFQRVLFSVRGRPEVQDVLMCVSEDMGDDWPFVDSVFVLTTASEAEVASWLAPLHVDKPYTLETWPGPTQFLPPLSADAHVVVGWWD
jgi:hypothetical protein